MTWNLETASKLRYIVVLALLTAGLVVAGEMEQRKIQTEREEIILSVPKEWPSVQTHRTPAGKPYFQLGPANTNYSIQLYLTEPLRHGTNFQELLERSLETGLQSLGKESVEGKVELVRFGKDKEGVYARLTDRSPKPGEFLFYTRGLRVIGTNVLGFELGSNDKDFSALSNTLAAIESVKVEGRAGVK